MCWKVNGKKYIHDFGLVGIWNASALGINNHAIFTYNYRLRSLTKYTQLSMESNGKSINFDSTISPLETSPLIWGGYGIDSQHSTFQWMMALTSCDFIELTMKIVNLEIHMRCFCHKFLL